ncbi:putative ribosomal protein l13 [Rosellinia necatrix]|uniref:Putative ribosomal protein l13 n=1 Tax=Rosellinia necatrix TaxID=77044 RepID=A0A1S8A9I2_ROSNE|nr:putative ribosomal protein l13 [Rosellinia necatrix]
MADLDAAEAHEVLLVGVGVALEGLEAGEALVAEAVLGEHAGDGLAEDLGAAVLGLEDVHGDGAQGARAGVVAVVRLLPHLAARDVQGGAVGHDDVVAAVGGRVPDGLVLAHQDRRDPGGQAAQRRRRHVRLRRERRVRRRGRDLVPYPRIG